MKNVSRALLALAFTLAAISFACGGSADAGVPTATSPADPGGSDDPNARGNVPADTGWAAGGQGSAPGQAPPAIVAACGALADAVCQRTKACAPGIFPALYMNDAACVAVNAKRCAADAMSPGVTLDANGTNACATAITTVTCEDLIDDRLPAVCRPSGTLASGAACLSGLQCKTGFCAGASKGSLCGVCSMPTKAGAACVAGTCPSGSTCQKNVCVARKKIGEPCTATSECGTGQVCLDGKACAAGGVEGTLCALDADCNILQGLRCSFTTNTCTKLAIVEIGQSCGVVGANAALCHASDCSNAGVCIARVKEGQACSSTTRCESGLSCVGSKCVPYDATLCK
jgi:hypothetical protein